jgi:hypothetical protein
MAFGYHPKPPIPSPSYTVSNCTDAQTTYCDFKSKQENNQETKTPSRDGLVFHDAALTRLRSWVKFPVLELFRILRM